MCIDLPYVATEVLTHWQQGNSSAELYLWVVAELLHISLVQEGCKFQCRSLDNPNAEERTVEFGPCRVHVFLDPNDVKTVADADYFMPASVVYAAVDSLLPCHASLFQATIAERHEVKNAGLIKALDLLPEEPEGGEYKLYFPVPEHRFAEFRKQRIVTGEGSGVKRKRTKRVKQVRQYALKVTF